MKLPIPNTFELGGVKHTTKHDETISDHGLDGCFLPAQAIIKILPGLQEDVEAETQVHEWVEAINDRYELKLKHAQIQTVAAGFWQILKSLKA